MEYKTIPKAVFLHYRLLRDNYKGTCNRTNDKCLLGIHVKEFLLFYNEELQYYITEELEDEISTTERS